jgi:hypothetical protein
MPVLPADDYDPMQMIRHDNKAVDIRVWKVIGDCTPKAVDYVAHG